MPFLFERPLAAKRVVVTRPVEQADELVAGLESLGAEIVFLPTIAFVEAQDLAPLDRAVLDLDKFDWVIFTSRNAVRFLVQRIPALNIPPKQRAHLLLTPKVAVIGPSTHAEALSVGFLPDYEAAESRGETLGAELLEHVRGRRVLLPRSDLANSTLPRILRDAGAEVAEVIAYRTIVPPLDAKILEAIRQGAVDVITFFSPSSYRHLADAVGVDALRRQSGKIMFATIGPTTSQALKADGMEVAIESLGATAEDLWEATIAYFRLRADRGVVKK
jgi:uroporphyrinogen III methyltransferase/synthase